MQGNWFNAARYGLFVHFGLYSALGRGEWALNRERIPFDEYSALAKNFNPAAFDAAAICDLAVRGGMRYIVFTTMHHDGFRLYQTKLSPFNSFQSCGRDLTREITEAAKKRGLKIGLYHSLNNWMDQPDGTAALENQADYETFIASTHARIRELVENYPMDTLWYDGWWPFNAEGWRAVEMNAMCLNIQPHLLFNGRNGLPGDFSTPEGHLSAPNPWRPWEACMTLNDTWGYHAGDDAWKTPANVIFMLATCAEGQGNLLLNVSPRGDGSLLLPPTQIIESVGAWLAHSGEAIYTTDPFYLDARERGKHTGDFSHHGPLTASGKNLYAILQRWPGETLVLAGLQVRVQRIVRLDAQQEYLFEQNDERIVVKNLGKDPEGLCPVLRLECDAPPNMYLSGGMRVPRVSHPPYDPCPSDIMH